MKRTLLAMLAICGLLAIGSSPALAASASFNVSVTIQPIIQIVKNADLSFGTVEDAATTYTVAAAASPGTGAGAAATAANFSITGANGTTANISFTSSAVSVTCTACLPVPPPLTVNLVTQGGGTTDTLALTGSAVSYYVGGSITLAGTETTGTYTGTATLNVVYQ